MATAVVLMLAWPGCAHIELAIVAVLLFQLQGTLDKACKMLKDTGQGSLHTGVSHGQQDFKHLQGHHNRLHSGGAFYISPSGIASVECAGSGSAIYLHMSYVQSFYSSSGCQGHEVFCRNLKHFDFELKLH